MRSAARRHEGPEPAEKRVRTTEAGEAGDGQTSEAKLESTEDRGSPVNDERQ